MMWLFLMSDALTFSGMLIGLWTLRLGSPILAGPLADHEHSARRLHDGHPDLQQHDDGVVGLRGAARAAAAGGLVHHGDVIAGFIFAALQATEWTHFIRTARGSTRNPWGVPSFSFTFFMITGYHGLHVLAGCFYLWAMAVRIAKG